LSGGGLASRLKSPNVLRFAEHSPRLDGAIRDRKQEAGWCTISGSCWLPQQSRKGPTDVVKQIAWMVVSFGVVAFGSERPRIVGIANIAVKVDNLDEARKFYSGVVGMDEAFTTKDPAVAGDLACFKVNDRQYVEVSPTLKGDEDRLIRIGFETSDAQKLRDYLDRKGVPVPAKVGKDANGNRSFVVKDPEGHAVQFVQYMPGSVHSRNFGKHLAATRISDHILHVGVRIVDPAKADTFYKDILGFRLQWKGGPCQTLEHCRDHRFRKISSTDSDAAWAA